MSGRLRGVPAATWVRVAKAVVVVLVLLHPGFGRAQGQGRATDLDVVIVVDRTRSMLAGDWSGDRPRLDGVRSDLDATASELAGSRFALVTVGRDVRVEMPFTTDVLALRAAGAGIRAEGVFDGSGSDPTRASDAVRDLLSRDAASHPDRRRVLLYLGDGERTESAAGSTGSTGSTGFNVAADHVDDALVVGYGTTAGAPIPVFDPDASERGDSGDAGSLGSDDDTMVTDTDGAEVRSRIDERSLRGIADDLDGRYVHSTRPGSTADALAEIDRDTAGSGDSAPYRHDLSWILGLALLGLALVELRGAVRSFVAARAEVRMP